MRVICSSKWNDYHINKNELSHLLFWTFRHDKLYQYSMVFAEIYKDNNWYRKTYSIYNLSFNKKSAESDVAPAGIKSYKFLFVLKKIYFAVFKKLMG